MINLRIGMPLFTKNGVRTSNAFVLDVGISHAGETTITVITDWGNRLRFSEEELLAQYDLPDSFLDDYPWLSPVERIQEQIDNLQQTLDSINKG